MDFSDTLSGLRAGAAARQRAWAPHYLLRLEPFQPDAESPREQHFTLQTGAHKLVWRPTREAILAEDWELLV